MTTIYPELADRDWLATQYVQFEKSTRDIARDLGCTPSAVQFRLRQFGIKARGRWHGKWKLKVCVNKDCQLEYIPSGPAQKFCSLTCQAGTRECDWCGKQFLKTPPQRKGGTVYPKKYCSVDCRNASKSAQSEACRSDPTLRRRVRSDGYVDINVGRERGGKDGRVREHRLVMEEYLGRRLREFEEVHHKNGIRSDNVLSNLELWTKPQPKGQRPEDLVDWVIENYRELIVNRLTLS